VPDSRPSTSATRENRPRPALPLLLPAALDQLSCGELITKYCSSISDLSARLASRLSPFGVGAVAAAAAAPHGAREVACRGSPTSDDAPWPPGAKRDVRGRARGRGRSRTPANGDGMARPQCGKGAPSALVNPIPRPSHSSSSSPGSYPCTGARPAPPSPCRLSLAPQRQHAAGTACSSRLVHAQRGPRAACTSARAHHSPPGHPSRPSSRASQRNGQPRLGVPFGPTAHLQKLQESVRFGESGLRLKPISMRATDSQKYRDCTYPTELVRFCRVRAVILLEYRLPRAGGLESTPCRRT